MLQIVIRREVNLYLTLVVFVERSPLSTFQSFVRCEVPGDADLRVR